MFLPLIGYVMLSKTCTISEVFNPDQKSITFITYFTEPNETMNIKTFRNYVGVIDDGYSIQSLPDTRLYKPNLGIRVMGGDK